VNPYVLELMGKTAPSVGLEGKFSIYHCAAIAYLDGAARTRQFTDEAVRRSDVVALRAKVRAEVDAALPTSAAHVRLTAQDGRTWEQEVRHASGTPENPLRDGELVEKFLDLVETKLPVASAQLIAERALDAGRLADVRELTALLQPAAATRG